MAEGQKSSLIHLSRGFAQRCRSKGTARDAMITSCIGGDVTLCISRCKPPNGDDLANCYARHRKWIPKTQIRPEFQIWTAMLSFGLSSYRARCLAPLPLCLRTKIPTSALVSKFWHWGWDHLCIWPLAAVWGPDRIFGFPALDKSDEAFQTGVMKEPG